jgi:DNA-directed RNA polymerase beta' subunit
VKLPATVQSQIEKKFREREVANPLEVIASALRYYLDNKVTPGEMVGSTGAANTGEPVTQAGLRAFHGGGKGNVPTVERVEQLLKLSREAIQQPQTTFYLKGEYNTKEYAQKIANFCSRLYLKDVVKLFSYDTEGLAITITFNDSVVETFEVDTGFIGEYLAHRGANSTYPYAVVQEEAGLRVQFKNLPSVMSATSFLVLMKETLELYQINGLMNAGRAFTEYQRHPAKDEPQWSVIVLGPEKPTTSTDKDGLLKKDTMVSDAENLIGDYIDLDLTRTNNPFHILQQYGIEAALACIKELFWEQMNGVNEKDRQTVKGMGELDYRYIDALVDNMGLTGVLHGLGRSGQMVATVTSLLGGIGGEDPGMSLRAHTLMGTYDELGGMVEAISAGKLPTLGRAYIKENEASE